MTEYIAYIILDGEVLDQTSLDENRPELARAIFEEWGYDLVLEGIEIKIEPA